MENHIGWVVSNIVQNRQTHRHVYSHIDRQTERHPVMFMAILLPHIRDNLVIKIPTTSLENNQPYQLTRDLKG